MTPAARARAPVTAAGLVAITAAAAALGRPATAPAIAAWLAIAAALWRPANATAPVGAATLVTLARGLLIALVAEFLAVQPARGWIAWAPGLLYLAAALADLVDGYLARRLAQVSALGAGLDVAADALGLLVAPAVAVRWGRLPPWYLALGAAFYAFNGGLWLRVRLGLPVHRDRLRPSRFARAFAGCQMGLTVAALLPVLPARAPVLTASVFMTPTLAVFARDWLLATGRLAPDGRAHAVLVRVGTELVGGPALLGVRLVVAALLAAMGRVDLLGLGLLLAAGVTPRLAAFAVAVALAFALDGMAATAAFVGASVVMVLGPGRGASWTPEERVLFRRFGEARRDRGARVAV
jgi:CDP-diacylglycerol--glycerol-3-phosphate 3-phosphatidyltransferase